MSLPRARKLLSGLALLATLTAQSHASALEVPPLRGRVNDLAGLIPGDRARALEERLARFEKETSHQIAVLTIPSLEGEDLEGFSIRVAESWKIGKKGFDNGVILLVAKNDRKLRIEVGYGLEGVLPDAIASRIVREVIVPHFRANDFTGGIEAGVEAVIKVTRGEPIPEIPRRRTSRQSPLYSWAIWPFFLLLFALGFLLNLSRNRRSYSSWTGRSRRGNDYWGGGFGGGFGGGGGFSGGGGGFGGGGASSSW